MASVRQTRTGKFELTIRNKLLPKPLYFTFDDEEKADSYGAQCDKWLAAGIVPGELQEHAAARPAPAVELLGPVIRGWLNTGDPSATDQALLEVLFSEMSGLKLVQLTYKWAEDWVRQLKLDRNLTPGSIRKRVQALARAIDWHLRQSPDSMVGNPLRLLPRGYSSYNEKDARDVAALGNGKVAKVDVQRDRRLVPSLNGEASEEQRILRTLAGEKRADRERALGGKDGAALRVMFLVILWAGLRLKEAYTLTIGQVDIDARVIRVRSSKQWRGREKWRRVPMRPELLPELVAYVDQLQGDVDALLFPFWDGTPEDQVKVSNRLSQRFRTVFEYAGCDELTEHDLRHEATCRWFELRAPGGGWMFRTEEINGIMGWAPGSTMAQRYASFRAEDLAARLYLVDQAQAA